MISINPRPIRVMAMTFSDGELSVRYQDSYGYHGDECLSGSHSLSLEVTRKKAVRKDGAIWASRTHPSGDMLLGAGGG